MILSGGIERFLGMPFAPQGQTQGINEILRASLSISTAAALIAAIFARETLSSVRKSLALPADKALLRGLTKVLSFCRFL
jgi:hypothetical protein